MQKDDVIYRRAAIDEAEKCIETYNSERGGQRERDAIKRVISGIKKLPSAQPERKKGKWIHGKEIARDYLSGGFTYIEYEDFHCSECGYTVRRIRWNVDGELIDRYCSFCGADLKGGTHEIDNTVSLL